MSKYETISVDIDEKLLCDSLRVWLSDQVNEHSFTIFEDIEKEVGTNLEEIQRAVGASILNHILSNLIEDQIKNQK